MNRGFGLVEIIVGSAIVAVVMLAVSSYYQSALKVSRSTAHLTQASFLLEEGIEIAHMFRNDGWANISTPADNTTYYLTFTNGKWATTTTNTFIDGVYERKLTLNDVYRDASDDIVTSGGTLDTGIRKAMITVRWREGTSTTTKTMSTYLANIF